MNETIENGGLPTSEWKERETSRGISDWIDGEGRGN